MKKTTIKFWAVDDRPREKLIAKGPASLSNAELIAILISSGNKEESALDLSQRILMNVDNDFRELSKLTVEKLMHFKGIGEAKAVSIVTAMEIGRRRELKALKSKPKVSCSKDVFQIMHPILHTLEHEEFWALYLNNSNKVLEKCQISKGGITGALVDIRLLFKRAVELAAVALVISHNHPSGKLKPSDADKQLTKKISKAGETLDIKLLDHIIVSEKSYFSFADSNEI